MGSHAILALAVAIALGNIGTVIAVKWTRRR
jgi:hypothetical protein